MKVTPLVMNAANTIASSAAAALISRPVYYALADLALEEDNEPVGLWSNGAFFRLGGE